MRRSLSSLAAATAALSLFAVAPAGASAFSFVGRHAPSGCELSALARHEDPIARPAAHAPAGLRVRDDKLAAVTAALAHPA